MTSPSDADLNERVRDCARRARRASRVLAGLSGAARRDLLMRFAEVLDEHRSGIAEANSTDFARAQAQLASGQLSRAMLDRLHLTGEKFDAVVEGVRQVASLADPLGRISLATELDRGLRLQRVTCPIGVIGVIFESRPDALVQIAALALMSGNGALLKGGSEAQQTNRALFEVLCLALERCGQPSDAFALLGSREDVPALLAAEGLVDLIIPRGSNAFVRQIQQSTTIPVLGHAEGLCHIYVDEAADLSMARAVAMDSKVTYPAACNAVETILVHKAVAARFIPDFVRDMVRAGVEVRGDRQACDLAGSPPVVPATDADWATEYLDLVVALRVVSTIDDAIEHIATYGSGHTDCIITGSASAFERFFRDVNSAGVYWNASTRFADGYRYGFGAEVGIATGKLHPRGPVGLEGLVTYKYKLIGAGHVVADYGGATGRHFTHKPLKE
ncbi:MAG: glutamate-5-semialdehyde dehydrogenase [Steroidobacteraceae bacterium]